MIIFMSTLRERLLEAMQDANLTKTDLWKGCGLSSGAITHWFNGSTQTLKGDSLLNAAKVLKVNPIWLNTGKGVKQLSAVHPLDEYKFEVMTSNEKNIILYHKIKALEMQIIKYNQLIKGINYDNFIQFSVFLFLFMILITCKFSNLRTYM